MSELGLWQIDKDPDGIRVRMLPPVALLLRQLLTDRPDHGHPLDTGDRARVIVPEADPLSRWEADDANARMLAAQQNLAAAARGVVLTTLGSTDGLTGFDTVLDDQEADAWMSTLNRLQLRLRSRVDPGQVGAAQPMFPPEEQAEIPAGDMPGMLVAVFLEELATAQLD